MATVFEVTVKPDAIKKRAQRQKKKIGTNVPSDATPQDDEESEGKPDKPVIVRNESGRFAEGTKIAGPGRPPKHAKNLLLFI